MLVALAGPASNLVMALVGAIVFRIVLAMRLDVGPCRPGLTAHFVVFNVMLSIFNLIPIPPLDGSTLLYRFLPPRQAWQIRPFLTQYGIFSPAGLRPRDPARLLSGFIYAVALSSWAR